jgi:hypothetical protein
MITFNFKISNPWSKSWATTNNFLLTDYRISRYKRLELQVSHWSNLGEIVSIHLDTDGLGWSSMHDHAGPSFDLTILWFYVSVKLYDNRHWNYDNNRWEDWNNE